MRGAIRGPYFASRRLRSTLELISSLLVICTPWTGDIVYNVKKNYSAASTGASFVFSGGSLSVGFLLIFSATV